MAYLYINEYAGLAETGQSDSIPAFCDPPTVTQRVATGSTSAAFQPTTQFVELEADSIMNFAFGPVASVTITTASSMRIAANERLIRRVPVNANYAVTTINNT